MSETADEEIHFQRQNVALLMERIRELEARVAELKTIVNDQCRDRCIRLAREREEC